MIQLWRFRGEGELPTIHRVGGVIAGSHTTAISSIAMGRGDVLWSAAGNKLLGTDIRRFPRTIFKLERRSNTRITQLHFYEGLLLLEVFVWFLLECYLPTLCPRL